MALVEILKQWLSLNDALAGEAASEELVQATRQAMAQIPGGEQSVPVPQAHFIGDGSVPFLVTGRISGDDDDSAYLVLAHDVGHAIDVFSEELQSESGIDPTQTNDLGEAVDDYGGAVEVIIVSSNCLS